MSSHLTALDLATRGRYKRTGYTSEHPGCLTRNVTAFSRGMPLLRSHAYPHETFHPAAFGQDIFPTSKPCWALEAFSCCVSGACLGCQKESDQPFALTLDGDATMNTLPPAQWGSLTDPKGMSSRTLGWLRQSLLEEPGPQAQIQTVDCSV